MAKDKMDFAQQNTERAMQATNWMRAIAEQSRQESKTEHRDTERMPVRYQPADSPVDCGNWGSRRHWLNPMLPDFCCQWVGHRATLADVAARRP